MTFCALCKGQDGSDIRYYPTSVLDSSFIGREIHLDFFHRSFLSFNNDTLVLKIDNTSIRFLERRNDNGFNNWFSQQFLESIDSLNSIAIKITSWIILDITKDSINVKPNYSLIFPKETFISDKLFKENFWFPKAMIIEVLVKSKQFGS